MGTIFSHREVVTTGASLAGWGHMVSAFLGDHLVATDMGPPLSLEPEGAAFARHTEHCCGHSLAAAHTYREGHLELVRQGRGGPLSGHNSPFPVVLPGRVIEPLGPRCSGTWLTPATSYCPLS